MWSKSRLPFRKVLRAESMDANGRVARSITDQAAGELMNQHIGPEFIGDAHAYYAVLAVADKGDLKPLWDRIKAGLQ